MLVEINDHNDNTKQHQHFPVACLRDEGFSCCCIAFFKCFNCMEQYLRKCIMISNCSTVTDHNIVSDSAEYCQHRVHGVMLIQSPLFSCELKCLARDKILETVS